MADYIDREKLLEEIDELKKKFWYIYTNPGDGGYEAIIRRHATKCVVDLCVLKAPAADVTEVRHGKWVKMYNNPNDGNYYCSECHNNIDVATGKVTPIDRGLLYCPNCGAKMDGDGNK